MPQSDEGIGPAINDYFQHIVMAPKTALDALKQLLAQGQQTAQPYVDQVTQALTPAPAPELPADINLPAQSKQDPRLKGLNRAKG